MYSASWNYILAGIMEQCTSRSDNEIALLAFHDALYMSTAETLGLLISAAF
jgi:hypothetical protein